MTTQTLNLNMIPHGVQPVVYASQFDEQTGAIIFKLYNDASPYTIPSGTSILVNGTKPDGTGFSYSAAGYTGNTVTVNVYKQMAAVAGDVRCELRLTRSGQTVGSLNFILRVEPTALDDGTISETVLPLIERAAEIAAEIDEYAETVATEAANASASASAAAASAASAATDAANVSAQYSALETVKTNANAAAAAANAAADVIDDLTAAATTLTPGSSATASFNRSTGVITFGIPRGAQGESGVVTNISGLVALTVDANGDLWAHYNDSELTADNFEYDSETGNLYYVIEEGA